MKRLLTGALALTLLTGTAAMAQPDHRDDHGGYSQGRDDNRGNDRHGNDNRGYDRHGNDRSREVHQRNDERRAEHRWARGERLPYAYYQDRSHYVDYRVYHLRAPPRGYRWVRTEDNNYALIALTTGLIAAIIASNH
jgi:Ni/Co efflux regulator RcnB